MMFRKMRRKNQELSRGACDEILKRCTSGVLALTGDDEYPYAVPMSYAYTGDRIYFHCAKEGHKLDAVEKCSKASFCVIDKDEVLPEKYTTLFKSVIVFGKITVLKSVDEMSEPIRVLALKYSPDDENGIAKEFESFKNNMYMLQLDIEHMSGKQCKEFLRNEVAQ